jgi:hypothetical protein
LLTPAWPLVMWFQAWHAMLIEPSRPPPGGGSLAGGAAPRPRERALPSPRGRRRGSPLPSCRSVDGGFGRVVLGCWERAGGPTGDFSGVVQGLARSPAPSAQRPDFLGGVFAGQVDQVQQLQAGAVATSTRCTSWPAGDIGRSYGKGSAIETISVKGGC